LIMDCNTNSQ